MENKLYYNEQDISLLLITKIEHVVREIAIRNDKTFEETYKKFINSNTHTALLNPASLLWTESAEFIADEYAREQGLSIP